MMKVKHLFSGMLAVLAVLLLTGCQWNENPVRTSLDILQTDLTLKVGESATRAASTESKDYEFIYTSSNPSVAIVDQTGKVTAMSEGTATITVTMPETKIGWYAAATRQYKVIVNKVSAAALVDVDKSTPLTLVAQADGKITVTFNNGITLANDIHYTINGGAEQTIAKNTTGAYDIAVKKGDVVQFYSLNTSLGGGSTVAGARGTTRAVDTGAKYINIRPSMKTEIYGNVMSLLKGKDNLESATALEAKNAFYGLFAGAEKLVNNAERLLVLPATTLTEGCYQNMFNGCKGIEKAPELPAPKLEKNCYQEMFYDCAKLNSVKCLATDITAENSTKDWLGKAGTEATGEKVLESVVPMTPNSDDGVPASWTTAGWAANEYNEASWNDTDKKVEFTKKTAASDPTVVADANADVTWSDGWYTVSGNVTITGNVTLGADTHLILQDGATLTINGQLDCRTNEKNLYIYGQKKGDGKLIVTNNIDIAISGSTNSGKTIEIHGGEITATSTSAFGFVNDGIKMYGGKLTATGNGTWVAGIAFTGGHFDGIAFTGGNFDVYGGEVEAINTGTTMAAHGIMGGDGGDILTVYGGTVKATGGTGDYSLAIYAMIKSGTPDIKFYFADTEGAWGDGASYSTATFAFSTAPSAPTYRYAKAE